MILRKNACLLPTTLVSILFCLLIGTSTTTAQVINGYAEVTNVAGSVLTVTNVDEAGGTFEDGDEVIIMQMQDDVIGGNTTNAATFGDLNAILSAGLYEKRTISTHTESVGVPTSITISGSLTNTYNTGANSKVQIITFPSFGSPDYTTTGNMSAKDWDGTTGGVLAFNVPGILTLSHNLSADNAGFLGGNTSINYYGGGTTCDATEYIKTTNHTRAGQKGESIYNTSSVNHEYSRGKVLNGGGGGSQDINAGGAGGGNYTAGGDGGLGWNGGAGCSPPAGGLGGISLSGSINVARIFMGGGGGGGQQNNSGSSAGGNGGGIILLKAGTITTSCVTSLSISANGETASGGGNDGQGGGGAAGSIVLEVDNWSVLGTCPLSISANGGNGGSVGVAGAHAGGGGGGQGVVFYSSVEPTINVTTNTNNGNGGANCTTCGSAGSGSGSNNDGIFDNTSGPLPISLLSFSAKAVNNKTVLLEWTTETEINNDFFTVEKSETGTNWVDIATVDGAGNSNTINTYTTTDDAPNPINYYRLKQTDFNGKFTYSPLAIANITSNEAPMVYIYPNPVKNELNINSSQIITQITLYNSIGSRVLSISPQTNIARLSTQQLPNGIYILKAISLGGDVIEKKISVIK